MYANLCGPGSSASLPSSQQHNFCDPAEILTVHDNGKDVGFGTIFKKQGFRKPTLFKVTEGLGMQLPSRDFDIDAVADHVGKFIHVHLVLIL